MLCNYFPTTFVLNILSTNNLHRKLKIYFIRFLSVNVLHFNKISKTIYDVVIQFNLEKD